MPRHDTPQPDHAPRASDAPAAPPDDPVYVFSRHSVREVDRLAVSEFAIPSIVLMENAALHLAEVVLDTLDDSAGSRVLILCGPGNNGGDGLAAARHLHNAGVDLTIVLSGPADNYKGDAAINCAIVKRMGLAVIEAGSTNPDAAIRDAISHAGGVDVVLDALLGTGADKPVKEPLATLIRGANALAERGAAVVSADIPSGLDADTGEPLGIAVKASTTVSFVGLKEGFLKLAAQAYIGDVVVADIGAPRDLVERLGRILEDHELHDEPTPRSGHERSGVQGRKPGRP